MHSRKHPAGVGEVEVAELPVDFHRHVWHERLWGSDCELRGGFPWKGRISWKRPLVGKHPEPSVLYITDSKVAQVLRGYRRMRIRFSLGLEGID